MATDRSFSSDFWLEDVLEQLSTEEKLIYVYLRTNGHTTLCGLYKITFKAISKALDVPVDIVKRTIKKLEKENILIYDSDLLFICRFPETQNADKAHYLPEHVQKYDKKLKTPNNKAYEAFYERFREVIENPIPKRSRRKTSEQMPSGEQTTKPIVLPSTSNSYPSRYSKANASSGEQRDSRANSSLSIAYPQSTVRLAGSIEQLIPTLPLDIYSNSNSNLDSNLNSNSNSDSNAFKGTASFSLFMQTANSAPPSYQENTRTLYTELSTNAVDNSTRGLIDQTKDKLRDGLHSWEAEQEKRTMRFRERMGNSSSSVH